MATAVAALLGSGSYIQKGVYTHTWNATVSGRGNPLSAVHLADKTIQIQGPTGGTSRIIIEGTNGDDASTATWITLTTPTDGALDFTNVTGGQLKGILQNPRLIRPHFETVTTGKTLSVILIAS